LLILRVLVLSLLATLVGRLWVLQVRDAGEYRRAANANQVRDIVTQPPRGEVVDDKGRPLLDNKTALVVRVNRAKLMTIDGTGQQVRTQLGTRVLTRLARVLRTSVSRLTAQIRLCDAKTPRPCWAGSPYEPIPVSQLKPTTGATRRALQIVETRENYPGVSVVTAPVRHYPRPQGALASSVLGYIGPISPQEIKQLPQAQRQASTDAMVGKSGIEAAYERYLHGRPGVKQVAVNAQGNPTGILENTHPRPGDTVVTNLDAKVQAKLEQSLHAAIRAQRAEGKTADYAAGVVLNVRTGGVVAMASEPTYRPDFFDSQPSAKAYKRLAHEKGSPQVDKAYGSAGPPGSTFKLITSSGILADGIFSIGGSEDCSSTFQGRHNFEGEAGGVESLHQAIVQSCDTWFYRVAAADWQRDQDRIKAGQKPIEGVQHIAHDYGLGENPGIDLPGAAYGYIPDRKNQKQYWEKVEKPNACAGAKRRPQGSKLQLLDEYNCKSGYIFEQGDQENEDTGQGMVTVSPLQLAVAYAAAANGGTVFEPRVAKAILSPRGKLIRRIKAPVRDHLPISKTDLDYIRNALYGVTTEPGGTGSGVFAGWPMGRVKVGGKTGTAELGNTSQDGAWFASFAGPGGGKPQYVTVIEVDRADQGAIAAAPAAKAMWSAIYGVGGEKAIFPGGVPPRKLPTLTTGTAPATLPSHRTHPGAKRGSG
jgi:penicillin-binding protein 2